VQPAGRACHDALVTSAPGRAFGPIVRPWQRYLRPPDMTTVRPHAEPYRAGSGRLGVLLLHGFTGSPLSMRPWAEYLAADGFRVVLPRLPGHGTTWQELNTTTWSDWYGTAELEFTSLATECDKVFVAALSMGAGLALRLAERYGYQVAGLTLVNPFINQKDPRVRILPLLMRLTPSFAGVVNDIAKPGVEEGGYRRLPLTALQSLVAAWPQLHAELGKVSSPLLIYQSSVDHTVDTSSVPLIMASVSSSDLALRTLERSYHVATLDYDAEEIFTGSSEFFRRLAKD
jgi:carboxylesterase